MEESEIIDERKQSYEYVLNSMEKLKVTEISFGEEDDEGNENFYKAIVVEPSTTVWDVPKIQKICSQAIINDVKINDWEQFVSILKGAGIDKETFKQIKECLTVNKSVNEKILDNKLALGDITKKQVEKAMTIKPKSKYVKISEK